MKRIELKLKQKVKQGHERDYGIHHGLKTTLVKMGGYDKLAGTARRLSRHLGEEMVDNIPYPETEQVEKGLGAVCLETWIFDQSGVTTRFDYFENGKYAFYITEKNGRTISNGTCN